MLIPHANIPITILILALLFLLLSFFLSLNKFYLEPISKIHSGSKTSNFGCKNLKTRRNINDIPPRFSVFSLEIDPFLSQKLFLRWVLVFIPIFIFIFFYSEKIAPFEYIYGNNKFSIDGSVTIDRIKLKKIDDVNSQYSRIQVYEGNDEITQKPIRLMRINKELHSGTFLDTNELLFKYAKFNRLGGHFNPDAKKALLIGGGGYTYANYFLGDTPLFDTEKIWSLDGKYYSNNNKISLPILISSDKDKLNLKRKLIFEDAKAKGSEEEGLYNFIEADNQKPEAKVVVRQADINKTGFPLNSGFIHVHEVSRNGTMGGVISPNYYVSKQGNRIGHSGLISGENKNAVINLDRPSREGEVLYPMLHRDNGNDRFDPLLVDGYENIESLDVVEIDPETTRLAYKYFNLNKNDPRLRIFHEDGRTYINRTKDKYDIIYVDAFRSFYSVPFQLMTLEAAGKLNNILAENGILVFNIPSALGGKMGKSFQSAYKTFKIAFPALRVYAVSDPKNQEIVQNIVVIGFKSKDRIRESLNDDSEINEQLSNLWEEKMEDNIPILTDDFAPVDFYINKLIEIPTM